MTSRAAEDRTPAAPLADGANRGAPSLDEVSLGEMLQIMDVARTVRRERELAEAQFSQDEWRARLRERLLASAGVTGEHPSAEEVDAAIELYLANLHSYRDPPPGLSVWLAHLYIRRHVVAAVVGVGLLAAAAVWGLW